MRHRLRGELSQRNNRSAVTNGRLLPRHVDQRTIWVRRVSDLIALLTADMGGIENLSTAEQAIIRRAAVLMTELERIELRLSQMEDEASARSLEQYQRMSNTLRRLLESLGLKRRQKDVTPSVREYLRSKAEAAE